MDTSNWENLRISLKRDENLSLDIVVHVPNVAYKLISMCWVPSVYIQYFIK